MLELNQLPQNYKFCALPNELINLKIYFCKYPIKGKFSYTQILEDKSSNYVISIASIDRL